VPESACVVKDDGLANPTEGEASSITSAGSSTIKSTFPGETYDSGPSTDGGETSKMGASTAGGATSSTGGSASRT
jgi:hypothetical protein